jgi:hypothetical protein
MVDERVYELYLDLKDKEEDLIEEGSKFTINSVIDSLRTIWKY